MKKYRESLSEKQLEEFKKKADDINNKNGKTTKQYEIPANEHKNFNSYLRNLRKNEKIGSKSELDEKALEKHRGDYEKYQSEY